MKKILLSLCLIVSINSFSQTLDTIYVRNLALRAEEWYWLKGSWLPTGEEEKKAWKKIRNTLVAAAPPNNSTMVTIDSVPGSIALSFYSIFLRGLKGETAFITNNISQNIKAYTPMLPFTNAIDAQYSNQFTNTRKNGKDDFEN